MTDHIDSSMQARLTQLARDELEISAALRGQSGFLAPVASGSAWPAHQPPRAVSSDETSIPQTSGAQLRALAQLAQEHSSMTSFREASAEVSTKAPSDGATCSPACKSGQGLCVNGICLCKSPWTGETCADAEPVDDEVPFEKDAQKLSPDVGEALKQKIDLPFAVFIWTTLFVFTFVCTSLCPQVCGRRSSGGPAMQLDDEYTYSEFEKTETQFDIIEAWTFDGRKRYEREGQNDFQRRHWFEDHVGGKLNQVKWPRIKPRH
jgi:hypothetical protein